MKVPPYFSSSTDADILCIEAISIGQNEPSCHRPQSSTSRRSFQRGVAPAQGQLEQETDDANRKTGEWPDHRHLELDARTRWLPLNIGDAAKDEQGNTFHGQPTSAC